MHRSVKARINYGILHYQAFYFGKTCAETWNFSLPKKLDLRKTKLFRNRPSSFCSTYPNICYRTKKMDYSVMIPDHCPRPLVVQAHKSHWTLIPLAYSRVLSHPITARPSSPLILWHHGLPPFRYWSWTTYSHVSDLAVQKHISLLMWHSNIIK
jgi:hypothetical protein